MNSRPDTDLAYVWECRGPEMGCRIIENPLNLVFVQCAESLPRPVSLLCPSAIIVG